MSHDYFVNKYLGKPYKHLGRDMDGVDCWGLIKLIYTELGHSVLDLDYEQEWSDNKNLFVDNYHEEWEKQCFPRNYDVALFLNKNGVACHAGLWINGKILHCSRKFGVVCVDVSKVGSRLDGYYRLKAMNDNSPS